MTALHLTGTIRRIEAAWIAVLPAGTLMRRAAGAVAASAERLARTLPRATPVVALVGPGNNGGDALLALMMLHERGFAVRALFASGERPGAADARGVHDRWLASGGRIDSLDGLQSMLAAAPLVIDGLFGIGLARPLEGAIAQAVGRLSASDVTVLAVDTPSGIDADTGAIVGGSGAAAVHAARTVTMIGDKAGLHTGAATEHVGTLEVADLGIDSMPDASPLAADGSLFTRDDAAALVPARPANAHKGSFGSVLVVGGATGMNGAALLAARASQACGAGRTSIASPDATVFDPGQPQLMTRAIDAPLDGVDAICIGCGLGQSEAARIALARALAAPASLVVDADALNLIAGDAALARALQARAQRREGAPDAVITPHPLEAARLLERSADEVQADRIGAALELAARFACTVALKGAGTVIASPQRVWTIVDEGTPALATAGTGDVLAGAIASLRAQGLAAANAAALGVWLHGHAARCWQERHRTGAGLSAARLPEMMTEAMHAP